MKKTLIGEAYIWLDKVDMRKRVVSWHKLFVSSSQANPWSASSKRRKVGDEFQLGSDQEAKRSQRKDRTIPLFFSLIMSSNEEEIMWCHNCHSPSLPATHPSPPLAPTGCDFSFQDTKTCENHWRGTSRNGALRRMWVFYFIFGAVHKLSLHIFHH